MAGPPQLTGIRTERGELTGPGRGLSPETHFLQYYPMNSPNGASSRRPSAQAHEPPEDMLHLN